MNHLESIAYETVVNPGGLSYKEWRGTLKPRFAIVLRDILLGYFGLFFFIAASVLTQIHYPGWIAFNIIVSSVCIGYCIAYLALFIHEAVHFNIHPDKKTNDTLAAIFLCAPLGLDIKTYRKIHWQHHQHLGTTEDAETSYFNGITPLFLFETLTGLHLLKVIRKKKQQPFAY